MKKSSIDPFQCLPFTERLNGFQSAIGIMLELYDELLNNKYRRGFDKNGLSVSLDASLLNAVPLHVLEKAKSVFMYSDSGNIDLTLTHLNECTSLKSLSFGAFVKPRGYDAIGHLTNLNRLAIETRSKELLPFDKFNRLLEFACHGESNLEGLEMVGNSLKALSLSDCKGLPEGLFQLQQLEYLEINGLKQPSSLEIIAENTNLKRLNLQRIQRLTDLSFLDNCSDLNYLTLSDIDDVSSLDTLKNNNCLKEIELRNCKNLRSIGTLSSFSCIEEIYVINCPNLNS